MKQNNRKSRWILFLRLAVVIFLLIGMTRAYFRVTDDFRIANITHDIPYHSEWEIPALTTDEQAKFDAILGQSFSYVGKGAQSYVFASADGRYVIKFFKFKHLKPSWFVSLLPNIPPFANYKEQLEKRKQRKFNSVFNGHRLAYERHKEESGFLFMQLLPTHQHKELTVIDKIGLKRTIDLGSVVYVIQEKGETLRTTMNTLLKKNNVELAQKRIGQVFDLYISEYRKGIFDHDHGVMHNIGFVNDKPFHLDVGKLNKDDNIKNPEYYRKDLQLIVRKITLWLNNNYPDKAPGLISYMQKRLNEA